VITAKSGQEIPEELRRAISADPERERHWAKARPSCQARYIDYVAEAKKPETRERRVGVVLAQMADFYRRHVPAD
jgi:uncharacterized protein YdeI (YjbR/CyaY-like superfamily)